ncbi:MAG: ATP-binding cassette domain-containing protein [Solirubrobacteraceae bacterium]
MSVVCEELVVEYLSGTRTVRPIDGLSVEVADGELALLLGASGAGKTTLLSVLAAMLRPTSGSVVVAGRQVVGLHGRELADFRQRTIGVVFQAFNLIPSLRANENVQLPLLAAGWSSSRARSRANSLLADLGLDERRDHRPGDLSGGQQQRVAIARALALDPPVLLADEPTAHLDYVHVESLVKLLRSIAAEGRTVIVSTHDERLTPIADRVIEMTPAGADAISLARVVELAAGEVLFNEGDPGELVYLIEEGEIEIVRPAGPGRPASGRRLHAGEYFGELAPMLKLPRTATARATVATRVLGMSGPEFRQRVRMDKLAELVADRET